MEDELIQAAQNGNLNEVQYLIAQGANPATNYNEPILGCLN